MGIHCTRCDGTGFLNINQIPSDIFDNGYDAIMEWIEEQDSDSHDVQECDCCDGSGEHGYDERVFDCM